MRDRVDERARARKEDKIRSEVERRTLATMLGLDVLEATLERAALRSGLLGARGLVGGRLRGLLGLLRLL